MAGLDQLPTEVLLLIINLVRSNRDFLAFSRTCRSIHNLTKNELPLRRRYRRIQIKENSDFDKAFAILLSILRRPQLGDYVCHIEYDRPPGGYVEYEMKNKDLKELSDDDSQRLQLAVENAGFTGEYAEKVINMVLQPNDFLPQYAGTQQDNLRPCWVAQALTALLVSVSPYLESMTASQPMFNFTGYHDAEARAKMGLTEEILRFPLEKLLMETNAYPEGKTYLQNLRSVEILPHQDSAWEDERFYRDFDLFGMISLFNRLPSMERTGIDIVIEDENGLSDLEPSSSNISRIRIDHSNLQTWFLSPLINSCKVLREFRYTIGGRGSQDGSFAAFNPRTFLKAILGHKTTLEILHIDADNDCYFVDIEGGGNHQPVSRDENEEEAAHNDPQGLWERTGSLHDFSVLTKLNIGIGILLYLVLGTQGMEAENPDYYTSFDEVVLADSLPDTLESLVIIGYEKGLREDFDKIVEQFMIDKDAKLPNLKHVSGIEEMIERAATVRHPDDESELLWEPEEDEWSEYEY